MSLSSLERALHTYTLSTCTEPFDIKSVPVAPVAPEAKSAVAVDGQFGSVVVWWHFSFIPPTLPSHLAELLVNNLFETDEAVNYFQQYFEAGFVLICTYV